MREKRAWEKRIHELGGPNYGVSSQCRLLLRFVRCLQLGWQLLTSARVSFAQSAPKVTDADGKRAYNADGYASLLVYFVLSCRRLPVGCWFLMPLELVVAGTSISAPRASFQA
jgi:hypothetical protein